MSGLQCAQKVGAELMVSLNGLRAIICSSISPTNTLPNPLAHKSTVNDGDKTPKKSGYKMF